MTRESSGPGAGRGPRGGGTARAPDTPGRFTGVAWVAQVVRETVAVEAGTLDEALEKFRAGDYEVLHSRVVERDLASATVEFDRGGSGDG
ncbi:MAG: hypothetical protein ACTSU5_02910 [Promethearchaeota archaeon]